MTTKSNTQRGTRGRRRFNSKFSDAGSAFDHYLQPKPYGDDYTFVVEINNRNALLKFFPPVVKKLPLNPSLMSGYLPLNFSQVAKRLLGDKQAALGNADNTALCKELDQYETENERPSVVWNEMELPPELLRRALSQHAKFAVKRYRVVQRALARLYAVAWFGRGPDCVEAKRLLESLLPKGKTNPITKWVPELAAKYRQMRLWILESEESMKVEFPKEIDRVKVLAELYNESTGVISAALRVAETTFLTERLAEVLVIPQETVRKSLAKRASL